VPGAHHDGSTVLAGTNLIAVVILEQSKVSEQGETFAALLAKLHEVSARCCF
jgi:hypothetical protein